MVRKVFVLAAVATVFGLMGCAGLPAAPAKPNLDVAEAAFRHLFGDNTNAGPVRCISMPGATAGAYADPAPEFLARFADIQTPVKGASQCARAPDGIGVADKETGKFAIIYTVGPAKCSSAGSCEVEATYFAAPTASAIWTYHLNKKNGRWVVTATDMLMIS
jgi:hypothetical protein